MHSHNIRKTIENTRTFLKQIRVLFEELHPFVPILARPTHQFLPLRVLGTPRSRSILQDIAHSSSAFTLRRMRHVAWHYVVHVVAHTLWTSFGELCFVAIPTRTALLSGSFCTYEDGEDDHETRSEGINCFILFQKPGMCTRCVI